MAQKEYIVEGIVQDSLGNNLSRATVSMFNEKNSLSLITKDDGRFRFSLSSAGRFDIFVTMKGYRTFKKKLVLTGNTGVLKVRPIVLSIAYQDLDPVTVKRIRPLTIGIDTITYNATAFTVRDGSALESLLKRLPGIEVDQEGNLLSQGKKIGKVLVNGNTFFGGDTRLAMQNLPAEIIEKIQIIDDYGDKARLIGVKLGEPAKILNVVLKQDKRNGVFGNIEAGYGAKGKFEDNWFTNAFAGERQLGISSSIANKSLSGDNFSRQANISYTDRWSPKWRQDANANISVEDPRSTGQTIQNSYYGNSQLHLEQLSRAVTHNNNGGLSSTSIYNPDAFNMLRISSAISNQQNNQYTETTYSSLQEDTVFTKRTDGNSQAQTNVQNRSFANQAYFEHQSRSSKRRFTATATVQLIQNRQFIDSKVNSTVVTGSQTSKVTDHNIVNNNVYNVNMNSQLNYYTSIGKTGFLEFSHTLTYTCNDNDKTTRYSADSTITPQLIDSLSQHYVFKSLEQRWHIGYNARVKQLNISLSMEGQPGQFRGDIPGKDAATDYHYFCWQPNAQFSVRLPKTRSISLQISGSTILPTLQQVQPVNDLSNPQYPVVGNPSLHTGFAQTANLQYEQSSLKAMQYFGFGINIGVSNVRNAIVTDITHPKDSSIVLQKTTYANANGLHDYNAGYHISLPSFFGHCLHISLKGDLSLGQSKYYTDQIAATLHAITGNQSIHIQWIFSDLFESDCFGNYTWANTSSFSSKAFSWSWQNKIYLLRHAIISIQCNQILANNSSGRWQFNPIFVSSYVEWQFGQKNKFSCKITGNDIFNSSNGFIQSINATGITQSRTNLIGGYFIVGLVWKWGKFNN
jgi:hypothetical protein